LAIAVALAAAGGVALGQTWMEAGDAGDLPGTAQLVGGSGPLLAIIGSMASSSDADLYVINICTPGSFSASTVGTTTWDTQLWLFRADGRGIVHNDDVVGGTTLQSRLTNLFVANLPPGRYLLGITGYNRDPLNSAGQLIWNNTPFRSERAPDGPGAVAGNIVVAMWTGTGPIGTYQIELTGSCFVSTCPGTGPNACSRADWDENGVIDFNDMLAFLNTFNAQDLCADLDSNEVVDFNDFLAYLNLFNAGC
jgi:hypothetical protein